MAKTLKDFLNERQLGPMVVKNPDEQKFIDKHVIAKVADRNGNDDELFKGSKVKMADRPSHRKGYNPGQDEEVYEELKGNQHKIDANKNGKIDGHDFKLLRKKKVNEASYLETDLKKRKKNNDKAVEDMKKMGSPMKNPHFGEEAEQIDELSKAALGSYVKKATKSAADLKATGSVHSSKTFGIHGSKEKQKAAQRQANIGKAVDKLTKEEAEQIDELSTPTLQSYRKKARAQGNAIVDKMKMGGGDWSKDQKDTKTLRKRAAGAQMSGKQLVKRGESLKTEEVEQIDELSKKTLGAYAQKAKTQLSRAEYLSGTKMGQRMHGAKPDAQERKLNQRANKRYAGLETAINKLAKEELELGEAMNSYDRYTSTHGDVMKMMKSIGDHLAAHKKAAISHSSPYDKKKGPHWGHVGDIDSIHSRLKDIHDQLAQQGEYAKVHEEVEDLEELSKNTLHSYIEKSAQDVHNQAYRAGKKEGGEGKYDSGKILKSLTRQIGISKATRKLAGKAKVNANEEVELDEKLTAKTPMGTYIKDFQKSDAPQFKGKSKEKRRVMAIAAKLSAERGGKPLNKEERLLANLGDLAESHKRTLLNVFAKLNEDNQRKFMATCETPEGIEQMLNFAIQNRGE